MLLEIIITVVITFIITASWQHFAEKRKTELYALLLKGLLKDMNDMAKEMNYKNLLEYFKNKKGDDYAQNVRHNIEATFRALYRIDLLAEVLTDYIITTDSDE